MTDHYTEATRLIAEARAALPDDARMDGYYIGFDRTEVAVIDAVLSAVAIAGKGAHHTEAWRDDGDGYYDGWPGLPSNPSGWNEALKDDGGSAVSLIQLAANRSAELVRRLVDALEAAYRERDAAVAVIERVRAVAMKHRSVEQHNEMVPLSDIADLIREPSSSEYLAALDGAPGPEH